ncbi:CLUMA_CG010637, isoform A [Clunio marinus]|uniref:CLUMA_CG010637, isoform A n=1 Tax=Clunio marinus TaxID=568069 RepID=A0A1J1IFL1_9DIPT|nr:CLUMA_CG010637, isoform A [Clunio marinus]
MMQKRRQEMALNPVAVDKLLRLLPFIFLQLFLESSLAVRLSYKLTEQKKLFCGYNQVARSLLKPIEDEIISFNFYFQAF